MRTYFVHSRMAVEAQRLTHGVGARWHAVRRRYKWWQLTLFVIGVIAAVSVMSALFFAVGNKPARVSTRTRRRRRSTRPTSPPRSAPLSALRSSTEAPFTILNNGDEFVPALLESDRPGEAARSTSSVYIWAEGTVSDQLLRALEKKQREGVAVRVLLDGLGSMKVPDEDFEPLMAAGGKVQKFRTPKFGKLTRFHRRNHRRSIVIDGEVGFTGGMAVSDVWLGHAQDKEHWRDMMFKVTGPLAQKPSDGVRGSVGQLVRRAADRSGALSRCRRPRRPQASSGSCIWPARRPTTISRWRIFICCRSSRRARASISRRRTSFPTAICRRRS